MSGLVTVRKSPRSIHPPPPRPTKREECRNNGIRPCPWYGCRYNLASDEHTDGTVRVDEDRIDAHVDRAIDAGRKPLELEPVRPSCVLDVAGMPMADGKERVMDVEEIAAATGLWHTNVEDALASGLAKLAQDPELASVWRDIVQRDGGHPLAQAQRWADPAEEQIGGRPMGKARNGA